MSYGSACRADLRVDPPTERIYDDQRLKAGNDEMAISGDQNQKGP